ncbi:chromatin remodelling complex Rsc7/Swp82 subunit-domain-containing protein [Mycena amicta]|nr:chromatin remodelling complex Rsc7/Swp82 subunit-domain-containing protein [Mycena amicta]
MDVDAAPTKRGRGRPRGSGRSIAPAPTPRPRGRPRGSVNRGPGRPRGSGMGRPINGGLTIRLPKRDDDDDYAGDGGGTEPEPDQPKDEEKEQPIGGGKPFRRINGQVYVIDGDEFVTEDDPKGDTKIDKWGNLLGGRRFKAGTFILPGRHPERRYMLAIDAARTSGFRDSLYYFRRNPLALKHNGTQAEKDYLISQGKLGPHLRTRSVTLVTARSAFKLHGSKTIFEGRWVVDDYYEDKVLEEITERGLKAGDPVGELPDPNAHHHTNEQSGANAASTAAKNDRLGAGTTGIYRAGGPTTLFASSGLGPFSDGPLNAVRKSLLSRDGVTEENWMWMTAMRTQQAGEEWAKNRKECVQPIDSSGNVKPDLQLQLPLGCYEPQTGQVLYRADTQPTQSRLEKAPDSQAKSILGGSKVGNAAWGIVWMDTVMESRPLKEAAKKEAAEKMRLWRESGGAYEPS